MKTKWSDELRHTLSHTILKAEPHLRNVNCVKILGISAFDHRKLTPLKNYDCNR